MKNRASSTVLLVAALIALMIFSGCPKKDTLMPTTTGVGSSAPEGSAAQPSKSAVASSGLSADGDEISSTPFGDGPDTDETALSASERAATGDDAYSAELAAARLAAAQGAVQSGSGALDPEAKARLASFTVYFDFDSADLRADAMPLLNQAAGALKANKTVKILLTGHCDERGTADYNLALGQRRAEAVRQYLIGRGVLAQTLDTVSMGAEEPADMGHDEEAWAKNRRVAFQVK